MPVNLEPELTQHVAGIDVQSHILESELVTRKQILMLEAPKVDVIARDTRETAKTEAESVRMFDASMLMELEEDYDVSGINSAGQIADGLVVWYVGHKMPPEPDEKWLAQRMQEKQLEQAEKPINQPRKEPSLEDLRDEWFEEYDEPIITLRQVPLGSILFDKMKDPGVVLEESEVPFLEWREYYQEDAKGKKKYLTLDDAGKVLFLGDTQQQDSPQVSSKKLKVCIHAYRVPGTKDDWKVCQYISPSGADQEGEKWQEYDSPFGCPYIFCASGAELPIETDPHLRFRPDLYPLYVVGRDENEWLTRLTALAFDHSSKRNLYIPFYGTNDDSFTRWIDGMGGHVEGAGAERRGVVSVTETRPGELFVAPRLEAIPVQIPEAMNLRIEQLAGMMQSLRTTRFLTGGASSEEITQGTAQAIQGQTEQATLPFENHLKKQKSFWKKLLEMVHRAIVTWDEGAPKGTQKKYMRRASGKEPVAKGKIEPGSDIYVDAEMLRKPMDIEIFIGNDTAAERQTKDAIAKAKYDWGVIDFSQLLEGLGFEDPEAQIRILNRERHLVQAKAQFQAAEEMERQKLWSALTGLDLAALSLSSPPMPSAMPGNGTSPNGQNGSGQRYPVPNQGLRQPAVRPGTEAPAGAPL